MNIDLGMCAYLPNTCCLRPFHNKATQQGKVGGERVKKAKVKWRRVRIGIRIVGILTKAEHCHAKTCIRQYGNRLCDNGRHLHIPPINKNKNKRRQFQQFKEKRRIKQSILNFITKTTYPTLGSFHPCTFWRDVYLRSFYKRKRQKIKRL